MNAFSITDPGFHEAEALRHHCDICGAWVAPGVVVDRDRTREAGYACRCGAHWVTRWEAP